MHYGLLLTRPLPRPRVRLEEGLVAQARALEHDEPAILRPVGREVQQALDALQALALGRLVDVRPGGVGLSFGMRQRHVRAVKGHQEFWGVPELGEGVDDGWFAEELCAILAGFVT